MFIVIYTHYTDQYGNYETGSTSFFNRKNYLASEIEDLFRKHNYWHKIIPGLSYLQDLSNNPNIFLPPNGEEYFVGISEIALQYVLPQDCHESELDIEDLVAIVKGSKSRKELVTSMYNKAMVELDQRMKWIEEVKSNELFKDYLLK